MRPSGREGRTRAKEIPEAERKETGNGFLREMISKEHIPAAKKQIEREIMDAEVNRDTVDVCLRTDS